MKTIARWVLSLQMLLAGLGHLTFAREPFQAQVPDWTTKVSGMDKDAVVVASGGVEIMFAAALVALPKDRPRIGVLLALFFAAVFPGNVEQYLKKRSMPGLDTDRKRLVRLFFQPLLMALAVWSTSAKR